MYTVSKDQSVITAANWLDGIAFGMTTLTFIIAAGENSAPNKRGKVASLEAVAVSTGFMIYSILVTITHELKPTLTYQGILSIIFGLAACGLSFFYIETPVYNLMKARNELSRLHNETDPSTNQISDELKEYVDYDDSKTMRQHIIEGSVPLAKIVIERVLMLFTMVYPITAMYVLAAPFLFNNQTSIAIMIFGIARWLGAVISQYIIDIVGRKKIVLSSLIIGILLFVTATMIGDMRSWSTVASLLLVTSFFCGLSQNVSTVYLSEAFAPSVKSIMIFIGIFVENIAVIALYAIMQHVPDFTPYFYIFGSFQIYLGVMAVTLLPETKHLSLQNALELFKRITNFGF